MKTSVHTHILDIRSTMLPSLVIWIKTTDLEALSTELQERVDQSPAFFNDEPVIIDISELQDATHPLPFGEWLELCRWHRMVPVGCRGGTPEQAQQAQSLGLALLPEGTQAPTAPISVIKEVEVKIEVPVPTRIPTRILDKHLRSGQQFYARESDLIVLAPVAAGAEIIADGNIHIYSPLRGKAIAGASGDQTARIFASDLSAELIAIAGVYRTLDETDHMEIWHGKTACISLTTEQRLHIQPLSG
jgi:septum site-determining protein MinC